MDYLVRKCKVDGLQYPADYEQACEVCFGDSWTFWCEKHSKSAEVLGCEDCAYQFAGVLHFQTKQLGEALFANWEPGRKHIAKHRISDWLLDCGADRLLAGKLREIERDETLSPEVKHSLILTLLINDDAIRWREKAVDRTSLRREEVSGVELLRSEVPEYTNTLGTCTWLFDLKKHWKSILAETPPTPYTDKTSFEILFNPANAKTLTAALSVATITPEIYLPSLGLGGFGRVAALAKPLAEEAIAEPSAFKLMDGFSRICKTLQDGMLLHLDKEQIYTATFLIAWRFEGKTLLENSQFQTYLKSHLQRSEDNRLLKSLVFGYFHEFTRNKPEFVTQLAALIRNFLNDRTSEARKWQKADDEYQVFSGLNAPAACVQRLRFDESLEAGLRTFGLAGSNLWEGFSAEMLLEWIYSRGAYDISDWTYIRQWFEKSLHAFSHREHEWVEAVVAGWIGKPAPGSIRSLVSRYLVDRFGEPDEAAPVWSHCQPVVRETVIRWLLFENLDKFFDVIADFAETTGGEMRSQWGYRKAFWLAVHKTGAVSDLRIAVGRGLMSAFGQEKLKDRFGSKLVKLNDSDERRCALVLKVGEFTIVDFTHNAKCRVWKTTSNQENWFTGEKLTRFSFRGGEDLVIRAHYSETGIAHFNSESYGWQEAMAEFLRKNLALNISRRDFEYKGREG